jgi:glucose/arabinose dehydrogenase
MEASPMRRTTPAALGLAAVLAATGLAARAGPDLHLDWINLPPGFAIDVYARGVEDARSMALAPSGVLFVGSREAGKVYALVDANGDHRADEVHTIAKGLDSPNGVAFHEGSLYVAEIGRIWRYDGIEQRLADPPQPVLVKGDLPTETYHGWKFIRFGPDGLLYFSVGAPCNVCETDDRHAAIFRMRPDGSGMETVARGVRNSVGFDWHPETKELWFTDNGRDMLGDDLPPDELNRVTALGQHFGFPYCHGGDVQDPEFGAKHPCADFVPPMQKLGAHVAALGMRFYTGSMFPPRYRNQIFIAEHGSWNRSKEVGYRVTQVTLDAAGKVSSYEPFASGWLGWGRPVDVQVMPDGALLVSDDQANAIYRISYRAEP